jgi:hypothetical protein
MSRTTVSICRESSARALVDEIVRDWLKDAMRAVPTPIRASSGTLVIASLMTCGILLLTVRPVCLDEEDPLPVVPQDIIIVAAKKQAETKRVFFMFNSKVKNLFSYENIYIKSKYAFLLMSGSIQKFKFSDVGFINAAVKRQDIP